MKYKENIYMCHCFIRSALCFGSGVYLATYYDCKPYITKLESFIKDNIPNKK